MTATATLDSLTDDALALPVDDRTILAHRLLKSLHADPPDPEIEAADTAEIVRRIAAMDAGEMIAIPAEEVFAHLRRVAAGEVEP